MNTEFASSTESTRSVAWSRRGCDSRRLSSPAMWSTSALVSTTALIGLCRSPSRGVQEGVLSDLLAKIGRGVAQHPVGAVGAQRDGRLGPRARGRVAAASPAAVGVVAVPLGVAAARAGTQHSNLHGAIVPRRARAAREIERPVRYAAAEARDRPGAGTARPEPKPKPKPGPGPGPAMFLRAADARAPTCRRIARADASAAVRNRTDRDVRDADE